MRESPSSSLLDALLDPSRAVDLPQCPRAPARVTNRIVPDATLYCSVTLIVTGHPLDPSDVTSLLGLEPDQLWRQGERKRVELAPGDATVLDSVHVRSGWKRLVPDRLRDSELSEQLAYWLDFVRENSESLAELRGRGHQLDLDCFCASSQWLRVAAVDLALMGAAGVDLELTIVSDDD